MKKLAKFEMVVVDVLMTVMAVEFTAMAVIATISIGPAGSQPFAPAEPVFLCICGLLLVLINVNLMKIRERLSEERDPKPTN